MPSSTASCEPPVALAALIARQQAGAGGPPPWPPHRLFDFTAGVSCIAVLLHSVAHVADETCPVLKISNRQLDAWRTRHVLDECGELEEAGCRQPALQVFSGRPLFHVGDAPLVREIC